MSASDSPDWLSALSRCLAQGNADQVLLIYLDEILAWRFSANKTQAWLALESNYGERDLAKNFEEFVDQLTIANPNNYLALFPAELSRAAAKKRYRLLIRVFHPDRGVKPEPWLNYRAERVNTAYSNFTKRIDTAGVKQGHRSRPKTHAAASRKPVMPRTKRRIIPPVSMSDIRRYVGTPAQFQKKVITCTAALALFIVALLMVSALAA